MSTSISSELVIWALRQTLVVLFEECNYFSANLITALCKYNASALLLP